MLDLFFFGSAVTGQGLFYLEGGVFKNRNFLLAGGEQNNTARLANLNNGFCVLEEENGLYLDAPEGGTITHQEHLPIEIPAGQYKIGRVLEYDHFLEEARQVRD